jgi:hypothetical protein
VCPRAQLFIRDGVAPHLFDGANVIWVYKRAQHRDLIAQSPYVVF